MSKHEKFNFTSYEQLEEKIKELGVNINLSQDLSPLAKPVKVGKKIAANSISTLPMEGCDSDPDGSPNEMVYRRYTRFSEGGYGLIWWEANSIVPEGKANELQMMLTKNNVEKFKDLVLTIKKAGHEKNGYEPLNILQLTQSGRYSRPVGHKAAPLIPQHDPLLDPLVGLKGDEPVLTDEYLESLIPHYVESAVLAKQAGYDGVDIKSCHRYLLSEILASHTRDGRFGGSFENRTRLILTIIKEVRKAVGDDFIIASRFNVFDAHPYPYGFGEDKKDFWKFNPVEPMKLVKLMVESGIDLLSNSAGNPYYIYPQVTRPFDSSSMGIPVPDEHPLESIARLFEFTRQIQKAAGDIPVVGNGYSWLRQYLPYAGAANVADRSCSFMGLGRSSFAYPNAPREILTTGKMDPNKCCISCSKCTQIMRDHGRTGCVVRDSALYAPLYLQYRKEADERAKALKK